MAETTFHNVTVTVEAETPEMAYEILCAMLASPLVEYTTDRYSTDTDPDRRHLPTDELFPDAGAAG